MYHHQVMLCKDLDEKRLRPSSTWAVKMDGVRAFYYPGVRHLISRDNKRIYGMDHIVEQCTALTRKHCSLDMELYIPGLEQDFNKASGIIRSHNDTPEVNALIFDVPTLANMRREREIFMTDSLKPRIDTLGLHSLHIPKFHPIADYPKRKASIFANPKFEGVVIYSPNHYYRNTRSYDWMRDVPIHSEDCVCTGVYEGKGKMEGIAGGIYVTFRGIKNCKVGTLKDFTYEDRRYLLEHSEEFIGIVHEVQFKELQPSGKPRQPRGKGWRYDKAA